MKLRSLRTNQHRIVHIFSQVNMKGIYPIRLGPEYTLEEQLEECDRLYTLAIFAVDWSDRYSLSWDEPEPIDYEAATLRCINNLREDIKYNALFETRGTTSMLGYRRTV